MANPNQEVKYTKLFINNEFVDAISKKTFPTLNPATEKKIADIAEGDKADIELAVKAAKEAFKRGSVWRKTDPSSRAALLNKLADLVLRDIEILASLEALDTGKPYTQAKAEVAWAAHSFRDYASYANKIYGRTMEDSGSLFSYSRNEPVGIAGQIIAWNFPIVLVASKWGPAITAGCTVVLKPAEQTPLTALHLAALSKEAGFPPGVINVVTGYGPTAGAAIASHKDIRIVSFTGSTEVGRLIMTAAAESNLKKVTLELGGKSPFVIFDDANLDEAVAAACHSIFWNSGQVCIAGSRTYVQESIYDEFIKRCVEHVKKRKLGSQFEEGIEQGPQVDRATFEKNLQYIEYGKQDGAKLELGGNRWGSVGYFVEPTIFSNVTEKMRIAQDEIFGPVMSILKFKTLDEVIDRANDTEYGLYSRVFTKNIDQALIFANSVEAGTCIVNAGSGGSGTPFGGYKQSGIGREGGTYGIEMYLEVKAVSVKLPY